MERATISSIQSAINEERWEEADSLISQFKKSEGEEYRADVFAVLEASCYIHKEEYTKATKCIHDGLTYNLLNYELYFMLGNIKEKQGKFAQALFSYENAALYANGDDKLFLEDFLKSFRERVGQLPGKVAIVLVNYNNLEYTKLCIESIERHGIHYPGSYEIIVVDNHSDDGSKEWLEQCPYKYIINDENRGFPAGCNQGIQLADRDSDIFLLNNDTIVMPNSIYCLRMGLYENEQIGMTGSVTNYASNDQMINQSYDTLEGYIEYCAAHNVYSTENHEMRIKLVGFAVMLKRKVVDEVGMLDEAFGLGHYEDDDLSVRCLKAGYRIVLCKDSFIYHYGNRSFCKRKQDDAQAHHEGIVKNYTYFMNKWGVDLSYYSHIRTEIAAMIKEPREKELRILEIGCGCGATLLKIKSMYPNAEIFGVELVQTVTDLVKKVINIECQNIEEEKLTYPLHSFDYIILGDVLEHLREPAETLRYLKDYLKENGFVIASIPNVMNHTVILPLLQGHFDYQEAGILDKTHLRFFTLNSIISLFIGNGFDISEMCELNNSASEENKILINKIAAISDKIREKEFYVYQYLLRARLKKND